jgi:osmotically-inducible protein OsmY
MAPLGLPVSVANGKVTLAGTTYSASLRNRAEKITHAVAGVFQIDNRIMRADPRQRVLSRNG